MIERHRGEVWLAELDPRDKVRPIVLLSREEAYVRRRRVAYVPVTSRIRRIPTHVAIADAGIATLEGAVNCDAIATIDQGRLVDRIGVLPRWKMAEIDEALKLALSLE